jgi:hypothetical protein
MLKDQFVLTVFNDQNCSVAMAVDPTPSQLAAMKVTYPEPQYRHEYLDADSLMQQCFAEEALAEEYELNYYCS